MKEKLKLSMNDLCKSLGRSVPKTLNLALGEWIPLWVELGDVDVYKVGKDGEKQAIDHSSIVKPAPEVLKTLFQLEEESPSTTETEEGFDWEISLSEAGKSIVRKEEGDSQLQRWTTTNYETSFDILSDKTLLYNAFPAISYDGEPIIVKQVDKLSIRKEEKSYFIHTFVKIKSSDLFAYAEDIAEFERSLKEDYFIGQIELCRAFDVGDDSFNAVKRSVQIAGFEFERLDGLKSSPMLKKLDVFKIKGLKPKKRSKTQK